MKHIKILLLWLLLLLASAGWCDEIHDAAFKGDMAKVKELMAKDPSLINAKGHNEKAPLHWAAQGGHLELAKYMVSRGAAIDALNNQKETPLVYAAENGHLKLAEFLIAKGADVNVKTTSLASPIHYALWAEHVEMVKLLLKKGADLKWERGTGFSLLHEAANHQSTELVGLLLKMGMTVDRKTNSGATPLHFAAMHGPVETVSLLIKKGADVNAVSESGWWPLGLAVNRGHLEMASRLLAAGCQVDRPDKVTRLTPLHAAAVKGYGKICALLIEKGADVNARGPEGRTPLYYASRYRNQGVVSLLKEKGATLAGKPMEKDWLSEPLGTKQAVVWYLGHSGWAVRTQKHLLIFDYWKRDAAPDEPALDNGSIWPQELEELDVTVFASHDHDDHFMPEIFAWRQFLPQITYVAGFKPVGKEECVLLTHREKREINGMEIIPIESNDSGQGFFIQVDGVSIFHPGDHANRQRDFSGPYKKEIDFLADQGLKADILFAPVSGCGFGDLVAVKKGVYYAMDRLAARSVFPMHAGGAEPRYRDFAKQAANAGYDVPFCLAEFAGDHFIVTAQEIQGAFARAQSCAKAGTGNCGN